MRHSGIEPYLRLLGILLILLALVLIFGAVVGDLVFALSGVLVGDVLYGLAFGVLVADIGFRSPAWYSPSATP